MGTPVSVPMFLGAFLCAAPYIHQAQGLDLQMFASICIGPALQLLVR